MSNRQRLPRKQTIYSVLFLAAVLSTFLSQALIPGGILQAASDRYWWRQDLIERFRQFKYALGDRVFPYAVVGEDGWLFYTGEMSLRNHQKVDPLNVSNIKKMMGIFRQLDAEVESYGGIFLVVAIPDKSTVYPQYMPDAIPVLGTTSSLDRLVERAGPGSGIEILDLRRALIEAGESSQVYYKKDSHWNCLGAYYAYAEIASRLSQDFPGISTRPLSDYEFTPADAKQSDIAQMMGIRNSEDAILVAPRFEVEVSAGTPIGGDVEIESLQTVESSRRDAPSLFIVHDSFYAACLGNFIEPEFRRVISVSYGDVEIPDLIRIIQKEKPDIMIVEFVERFMDYFLWHFYE